MPDDRLEELLSGLDGPRRLPPDLRERLEHELVAGGGARPLPPELTQRLSDHLSPRRRRWDPAGWLKVAAALVVAAGVAAALTVHPGGHAKPAPTASKAAPPLTTQRGASAGVNSSQNASLSPTASKAAPSAATPSAAGGSAQSGSAGQFSGAATPAVTANAGGAKVTAVAPNSGPATGGTVVTITGSNLSGASAVRFGPNPARSFEVVSDTEIRALSPAHSPATVYVVVTTPHGSTAPSATFRYLG